MAAAENHIDTRWAEDIASRSVRESEKFKAKAQLASKFLSTAMFSVLDCEEKTLRTKGVILSEDVLAKSTLMASNSELWEGTVSFVDGVNKKFSAILKAKSIEAEDQIVDMDLNQVSKQDIELVRPGAIFYLVFYEGRVRGTMRHRHELRFQRLPKWTTWQVKRVYKEAEDLLRNIKIAPLAE